MLIKIFNTLIKTSIVFATLIASISTAHAGVVNGGSLLSLADADQLETWLGVGDQDFTNIWTGTAGVSTASSFHAAADGVGATFSIYGITNGDGSTARIGGYISGDWEAPGSYQTDSEAFIFNLDTLEVQFSQQHPQYAYVALDSYFPTFGGGHDIFAGHGILGQCNSNGTNPSCQGYSSSHSYDQSQGQITIAGDSGSGNGNSGNFNNHWSVNSLEVYTFNNATSVPEPGMLVLFGIGLVGLGTRRRKIP